MIRQHASTRALQNNPNRPLVLHSPNTVIGIGEWAVSNRPDEVLQTFALGSCVAVIFLHHPSRSVGMVHISLPDSRINPQLARERPGYFADTGITIVLDAFQQLLGYERNLKKGMVIKMTGGANVMDAQHTFKIGLRNSLAARQILQAQGLEPVASDLGGNFSRTVTVSLKTGQVQISRFGHPHWLL